MSVSDPSVRTADDDSPATAMVASGEVGTDEQLSDGASSSLTRAPEAPPAEAVASPSRPLLVATSDAQLAWESESPEQRRHRRRRRTIIWIVLVVLVTSGVFVLQATTLQTFTISARSTSMEPALEPGDRIVAWKGPFTVQQGDIVVLRPPPTAVRDRDHEDLVKRVVGMPGDAIWSVGNTIWIKEPGKNSRPHIFHPSWMIPNEPLGPMINYQVIPPGQYFLLGDNLAPSYDSRYWGSVPRGDIVAEVQCIVWQGGPTLHCF